MAGVKTFALGLVVVALAGRAAHADAIVWRWTTWTPGQAVSVANVVETAPVTPSITLAAQPSPPPAPPASVVFTPPPPAPAPAPAASPAPPASGDPYAWQNMGRWAATSPVAASLPSTPPASGPAVADGFINLSDGPFPSSGQLTTGGAQPWYDSSVVTHLFGGIPSAQQRADFTNAILQRAEQTYEQSGVPVNLTTDPNTPAAHTISIVSGTSYGPNANVAGITNQGGDGVSFIDKLGGAQSVDQLEWVLAHNVAHELMHAFGVDHHDKTGSFLDSAITSWSTMIDPNAQFSAAAVQDLLSKNFQANNVNSAGPDGQLIGSSVPEPASVILWMVVGTAVALRARRFGLRPSNA